MAMDLQSVLRSLEERDKWRDRLLALQTSLAEIRSQRRKAEARRRRILREVKRLETVAESVGQPRSTGSRREGGVIGSSTSSLVPPR